MNHIFFVIDTQFYGKQYLLEYPFTENTFEYIHNRFSASKKGSQGAVFTASQTNPDFNETFHQDELIQLFLIEQKKRGQFTFDIMIEDLQYVSYPTWIDQNKYFKAKKGEEEAFEEDKQLPSSTSESIKDKEKEKEEGVKYIKLEMFNLVFVLNKAEVLSSRKKSNLIQNLYINLEAYSRFLLFEEFRKHYLGLEFIHLVKFYDRFFGKENQDISYKRFLEQIPTKTNIYKNMENMYNGIKKAEIARVTLNNVDFKYFMDIKLFTTFSIRSYNSIILIKTKRIKEFFQYSADVNPMLLVFLDKMTPFKSILDVSIENHIDITMLLNFVNQLEAWGLAKKGFKIQNHSVFQVNSHMIISEPKTETVFSPMDIFSVLNCFTMCKPGTTIEQLYVNEFKKTLDNEKFLKGLIYLLENEYLLQCCLVLKTKLMFRKRYDFEKETLERFKVMTRKHRNEIKELRGSVKRDKEDNNNNNGNRKEDEMDIEDKMIGIDGDEEIDYDLCGDDDYDDDNNNDNDEDIFYYEDFLEEIKLVNNDHYFLMRNIAPLLFEKKYFSIEEISIHSGYKVHKIIEAVEHYSYIFDTFIIPINDEDT